MSALANLNQRIAAKVTAAVSTMWSAYFFAALALISLPAAIRSGETLIIVAWVAQTFLQLVLLSIIMVSQKMSSASVEKMITETRTTTLSELEIAKEARTVLNHELAQLKQIATEIHQVLRDVEAKK